MWPFLLGDGLLLVMAGVIVQMSPRPLGAAAAALCVGCVGLAAWFGVVPFLKRYAAVEKRLEIAGLKSTVEQIDHLDEIAHQVNQATGFLQTMMDQAEKTVALVNGLSDTMNTTARDFQQNLKQAERREQSVLRLEVDKMRRNEGEWLQTLVFILDHVRALHQAATQSGQPDLIRQLGSFQGACLDASRRVGLVPFVPQEGERFDPQLHKLATAGVALPADAAVSRVMAAGFQYQGQVIRPALVESGGDPETFPEEMRMPEGDDAEPAGG